MDELGDACGPAVPSPLTDPARLTSLRQVMTGAAPDEAFDRFASLVKRMLGVPVALVSLVDDLRQFFPGQIGLPEPWAGRRETPLSHSFCQHVVDEGVPKVFPDARIYAQVRDNLAIPELSVVAYAGMPLTDADGRTLGSLCAIDTKPRAWTKDELAILTDLAEACASELRLRIARAVADEARRHAESAQAQLAMLAELTEAFARTLDIDAGMRLLASGVVPRLADWSVVTLAGEDGAVRQVAGAHHDPARKADVDRLTELMAARLEPMSLQRSGATVRDGSQPLLTDPEMRELADRLGTASYVVAPVTTPVGQRVLGSITLVNGPGRPAFTEADERTALDIARRAGLTIDNTRLYRKQRHVAEVLQHSLLTELPKIPGVELSARYLPAQDGAAVGGDWYDAFAQPDGSIMLAVGDVTGHDIEAAAAMGQLRNLVRGDAYARDDEPARLLSRLDLAMRGLNMGTAATAVLARVSRAGAGFAVAFSNAGHPPPLLLRPDGTVEVWWERPELLLGLVPRPGRTTHHRTIPAGSTLVLYTDGLVERPGQVIDEGIAELAQTLREGAGLSGDDLCDLLAGGGVRRPDDIALLLIRVL
ncbi:GAF domain-containing SpoIIE family protein phosphatase [Actinoplanes sp. N902-109]|uniref:GAF domain-containing SpoIIE family protein phosphatase n=1 Tax=Actinoplanes sp. (strain N902-109) TaxID=649831 RepID=UPI000329530E|nr:SpoIIE family protein phosphatase [Actinoplanes sp. N902-109]AGL14742.1 protein serine phosphatase with gaf(s) sensor(s) [Actinoplanes sp. N902-109]